MKDTFSGSDAAFEALLKSITRQFPDPPLLAALAAFEAARREAAAAEVAAKTATTAKAAARKQAAALFRQKIRQVRADPSVGDAVIAGMGLKVRDRKPSRVPPPTAVPLLQVHPAGRCRHKICVTTVGSRARGKPRGAMGLQLELRSPDVPTGSAYSDWTHVALLTRSPAIRTVPLAPGKLALWRGRWQNTRGEVGSWSEVVEATVTA